MQLLLMFEQMLSYYQIVRCTGKCELWTIHFPLNNAYLETGGGSMIEQKELL